jgi:hypothetical protein
MSEQKGKAKRKYVVLCSTLMTDEVCTGGVWDGERKTKGEKDESEHEGNHGPSSPAKEGKKEHGDNEESKENEGSTSTSSKVAGNSCKLHLTVIVTKDVHANGAQESIEISNTPARVNKNRGLYVSISSHKKPIKTRTRGCRYCTWGQ